jgi:hypothetical protein
MMVVLYLLCRIYTEEGKSLLPERTVNSEKEDGVL